MFPESTLNSSDLQCKCLIIIMTIIREKEAYYARKMLVQKELPGCRFHCHSLSLCCITKVVRKVDEMIEKLLMTIRTGCCVGFLSYSKSIQFSFSFFAKNRLELLNKRLRQG